MSIALGHQALILKKQVPFFSWRSPSLMHHYSAWCHHDLVVTLRYAVVGQSFEFCQDWVMHPYYRDAAQVNCLARRFSAFQLCCFLQLISETQRTLVCCLAAAQQTVYTKQGLQTASQSLSIGTVMIHAAKYLFQCWKMIRICHMHQLSTPKYASVSFYSRIITVMTSWCHITWVTSLYIVQIRSGMTVYQLQQWQSPQYSLANAILQHSDDFVAYCNPFVRYEVQLRATRHISGTNALLLVCDSLIWAVDTY